MTKDKNTALITLRVNEHRKQEYFNAAKRHGYSTLSAFVRDLVRIDLGDKPIEGPNKVATYSKPRPAKRNRPAPAPAPAPSPKPMPEPKKSVRVDPFYADYFNPHDDHY